MKKDLQWLIAKVLKEHGISADRALTAMVGVMVERHIDVELRRIGKRPPYPIHNERADALKATNDALHQAMHSGGDQDLLRAVMAVLMHAQFAAEKEVGLDKDEEDEGPKMRLHKD